MNEIVSNPSEVPAAPPDAGFTNQLQTSYDQAKMYPRDIEKGIERAMKELEAVPALAEKAYYSIPYKEGNSKHMVEGLTIKAAMALARYWGNIAADARRIGEDKSKIYVRGAAIDLETNFPNATEVAVSKYYKPRGSEGVLPWPPDMLRNQELAGMSKAKRNAVLQLIPDYFKDMYFNRAKELVINPPKKLGKPVESIQVRTMNGKTAIVKGFGLKIHEVDDYMEEFYGGVDEGSYLAGVIGLYNALKGGHMSPDDVRKGNRAPHMPREKKNG